VFLKREIRESKIYKGPGNKNIILEYLFKKKRRKELDISNIKRNKANIISL
jgi:hypothetical protein